MKYALPVCMAAAAVLSAPLSSAATLDFDHVFSTRGEPAATHFEATYLAGGAEHHVEVWRDGERRIRRRTDDKAESFALRTPGIR